MKKTSFFILAVLIVIVSLLYFRGGVSDSMPSLKVGVTSGPHALILEHVKERAKKQGLDVKIIEFDDFILPNAALNQGDIQVNSYQHQPFLDEQVKNRRYTIHSIGKSVLMPMGIYSHKIKSLDEIQHAAKIGVPNDPTNGGRALLLLQKAGLITIKADVQQPTLLDIIGNPKDLKIVELDAPQLPRSLEDLDAAVINTDWVFLAKMNVKSAIYIEAPDSPYVNIIAVKMGDENLPEIKRFMDLYHSEDTKKFIEEIFKGAVLPGW